MGFGDFLEDIAPIAGTVIGSAVGGPVGGAIGGGIGGAIQADAARRRQAEANQANYEKQKEFAQNGIRWKVADSIAAGIHPLVGLGASTQSFAANIMPEPTADMSGLGQDISRAVHATRTQDERDLSTLQIQGAKLDLQGKELDNAIKAKALNAPVGPPMPGSATFIDGQGNSAGPGRISNKAQERVVSAANSPASEPGAHTSVGWANTHDGGLIPVPSKDMKEKMEDNFFHEAAHFARNNIAPNWGGGPKPPGAPPKGYNTWQWDVSRQAFYPAIKLADGEVVWSHKELLKPRRKR